MQSFLVCDQIPIVLLAMRSLAKVILTIHQNRSTTPWARSRFVARR